MAAFFREPHPLHHRIHYSLALFADRAVMHGFFDVGGPTRSMDTGAVQGTSDDLDMRSSVALFPCSMGNVSSSVSGADILIGQSQVSG